MFSGTTWKADRNGEFHERLSYYILKKNKRLEDFAEETGISKGAISGYCTGRSSPSIERVIAMCDCLKISITKLTGVTGK